MPIEERSAAPAIEKMIAIIELLACNDVGYSFNELARVTGIPLNSVYRICVELEKKNYLVRENELLYIGPAFYLIGRAAEKRMELVNVAKPFLRELNELSNETVHLDILTDEYDMILVDQIETAQSIKMSVSTGMHGILHASGFGKCLLAWNEPEKYPDEKLTRLTANTITERGALLAECEKIRRLGYAIDNEEYVEGVYCIGAPIFNTEGKCFAAIGIMYLRYRYDEEKECAGIEAVTDAARRITAIFGGKQQEV